MSYMFQIKKGVVCRYECRRKRRSGDDHDIEWGNTSPHSQASCLEMRSGNEARIHR